MRWKTPRITLEWPAPVTVMGVINVTPDSFSDGGRHLDPHAAVRGALAMVKAGAQILDIGGESSRPGAAPVSLEEELARVIPVVEALRPRTEALISVDTYKAKVAEAAMAAGADVINDISGFEADPEMASVAAATGAGVILMHMRGTPETMQVGDLAAEDINAMAMGALKAAMEKATAAGVDPEAICLDPGIGFGKTVEQNLQLIARLDEWSIFGRPLLLGVSRKSFIGALTGQPVEGRRWGTAAAIACGIWQGCQIIRVHDVDEMRDVAVVAQAIAGARRGR